MTVCLPEMCSNEILFHVHADYDYRYDAGNRKQIIFDTVRAIINLQVKAKLRHA